MLIHLLFERAETTDGTQCFEAQASTQEDRHAAVMADVQQVMDWLHARFPGQQGAVEEGATWDADCLVQHEAAGWVTVTLTVTAAAHAADAFFARFGDPTD
ncbi:hypothetical protein [Ideonella sp.]|uniref:hypothetical protein n=1 Tax=Ideonella sp. TaxID=1929293 RepID=UPI0035B2E98B